MSKRSISDLLFTFGARYHTRITKNQKIRYLTLLMNEFKEHNYSKVELLKVKYNRKTSYFGIVGNPNLARTLIITYYDTPVLNFAGSKYKPFNDEQMKKRNSINFIVPMVIITLILLAVAFFWLVPNYQDDQFTVWDILVSVLVIITTLLSGQISKLGGLPKRENLIRNSSSIVAVMKYAEQLSSTKKEKIAFAFVDYGASDYFGYYILKEYLKSDSRKPAIILDNVGAGSIETSQSKSDILTSYFDNVTFLYGTSNNSKSADLDTNIKYCVEELNNRIK